MTNSTVPIQYSQRVFEQAVSWFVAMQNESCTAKQQQRFARWLAQHPSHQAAYAEAEKLWTHLDHLKVVDIPSLNAARQAKSRPLSAFKTTLVSGLLIAILIGAWLDFRAETLIETTGLGQRRTLLLADGSRIEMNAQSQLSVHVSWLRRSIELLQGEAMFTVAHEPWRPFTVLTAGLKVKDIGTQFNVRNRQQDISVTVLEGEVALTPAHAWWSESLTAGFSRHLNRNQRLSAQQAVDLTTVSAWTEGRLHYKQTPLRQIVTELEQHHAVKFVFTDPSLANETLTGNIATTDLKPFLRALEAMLPVHIKRQDQLVVIGRNP